MLRVPRFVSPVGGVHTATVSGVVRITAPEPDRNDFTAARRGAKTLVLEGKPVGHRVLRGGWPRPASRTWLPWCSALLRGAAVRQAGCFPAGCGRGPPSPSRDRARSCPGRAGCSPAPDGRVADTSWSGRSRVSAAHLWLPPILLPSPWQRLTGAEQIWNIALPTTGDRRSRDRYGTSPSPRPATDGPGRLGCHLRDSRSRTINVAAAGEPLTKPKNGPKSCVAEKPVTYKPSRLVWKASSSTGKPLDTLTCLSTPAR